MEQTLREEIPLRRRKIIKKSLGRLIRVVSIAAVLTVIFFGVYTLMEDGDTAMAHRFVAQEGQIRFVWYSVMAAWIFWEPIYQYLYFAMYFYDMDEKNVIIRKGVVVQKEIILPFAKITDVYVDQDAPDVVLGLYDVHISTPTAESGAFAHIDGVDRKGAMTLRQMILEKINADKDS